MKKSTKIAIIVGAVLLAGLLIFLLVLFLVILKKKPTPESVPAEQPKANVIDHVNLLKNEAFQEEALPQGVSQAEGGIPNWEIISGRVMRMRSNHADYDRLLAPLGQTQFVALYGNNASIKQSMLGFIIGNKYELNLVAGSRHAINSPLVGTITVILDGDTVLMPPTATPFIPIKEGDNTIKGMQWYGPFLFTPTKTAHAIQITLNGDPAAGREITSAIGAVMVTNSYK